MPRPSGPKTSLALALLAEPIDDDSRICQFTPTDDAAVAAGSRVTQDLATMNCTRNSSALRRGTPSNSTVNERLFQNFRLLMVLWRWKGFFWGVASIRSHEQSLGQQRDYAARCRVGWLLAEDLANEIEFA